MKHYMILLFAAALAIGGCASTGEGSNDYFGYNAKPDEEEYVASANTAQATKADDSEWQNPLSSKQANAQPAAPAQDQQVVYVQPTYYQYASPMYVPVITPWWNGYYGWLGSHRGISVTYYYGGYYDYGWYSPWYDYNPYYGWAWSRPHYYYHRGWYYQPYRSYRHDPIAKEKEYRTFGPSRGNIYTANYTNGEPGGSRSKANPFGFGSSSAEKSSSSPAATRIDAYDNRGRSSYGRTSQSPAAETNVRSSYGRNSGAAYETRSSRSSGSNSSDNTRVGADYDASRAPSRATSSSSKNQNEVFRSSGSSNSRSSGSSYRSSGSSNSRSSGSSYKPSGSSNSRSSGSSYKPSGSSNSRSSGSSYKPSGSSNSRSSGSSYKPSGSRSSKSSGSSSGGNSGSSRSSRGKKK